MLLKKLFLKAQAPAAGSKYAKLKYASSAEYCLQTVKKNEYENFMCTLFLKGNSRSSAFAIRSFNIEISNVLKLVTNKDIGLLRIQFWEETLEKCYLKELNKVPQHPVALELFKAINRSNLTKKHLKTLITSRKNYLLNNTFNSLQDVEDYAEQSVSSVYYLLLEGNGTRNLHADHAASHLGKAQGIVQILRSTPYARLLNVVPLPQEILVKHKVSQEDILRGLNKEKIIECTYEVASCAHQHLTKAREMLERVPKESRSILLPAINIHSYLERLQGVHYDAFHPKLLQKPWNWVLKLWLANFQNKY